MAAGEALGRQFLKADPNQLAFPTMENLAHPGAHLVGAGYRFEHEAVPEPADSEVKMHRLSLIHPSGQYASHLEWVNKKHARTGLSPGEIAMVETEPGFEHRGLASSLYGVARSMARVKPRHSVVRTLAGDAWAQSVSRKFGGRVPKKNVM